MDLLEKNMVDILKSLKEEHHVVGVKSEFESECTTIEETLKLKEIASKANLDLTIKIGGCSSIKDMHDAKTIGAKAIVAPMIESPYAAKKFVEASKIVFSSKEQSAIKFLINIETKYGFQYLDEILDSDFAKNLSGIVMGRSDMTGSIGISKDDVNHEIIFQYANTMANKISEHKKELIIGGGVSGASLLFFKRLPIGALTRFETRKVIFDAQETLKDINAEKGIAKAIEFELTWLKNKEKSLGKIYSEDIARVQTLKERYETQKVIISNAYV